MATEVTALIVDDLADNRLLFRTILEALGVRCLEGKTGTEAVEAVRSSIELGKKLSIVFLDMMMPEMGGIEAAKCIRDAGYKGPILAFSADTSTKTAKDAKQAGVDHYFVKSAFNKKLASALLEVHCGLSFVESEAPTEP
jgi:CheY-like chemotaxis protein